MDKFYRNIGIIAGFYLTVIVFGLLLMLTGCSPSIKEGEIYDKQFHPAHTQIIMMPIVRVITSGKTTTKYTTFIPMTFFYPDTWEISYKAFDSKKNKWKTATIYTSKEVYDMATIGSWYEKKDADFVEQPRTRVE